MFYFFHVIVADGVSSPGRAIMDDLDGLKRNLDQLHVTLSSRLQETLPRDLAQVEAMVVKHKVSHCVFAW